MTSSPSRGEQDRKKNSLRSFVNVFLKLLPDQSPTGINREHLRWGGGRRYGGVTAERRREGKSLKMPRDKRITDQYGRMDFVILKMAVREVHSHLPGAPRAGPSRHSSIYPLFFTATRFPEAGVNVKRGSLGCRARAVLFADGHVAARWAGKHVPGPRSQ